MASFTAILATGAVLLTANGAAARSLNTDGDLPAHLIVADTGLRCGEAPFEICCPAEYGACAPGLVCMGGLCEPCGDDGEAECDAGAADVWSATFMTAASDGDEFLPIDLDVGVEAQGGFYGYAVAGAYGSEAVAGIYGFEGPEFGGFKYVGNGNNNAGGDVDNGDDDDFTDDMESELPGNVNDEVKPKDFGSDVTNLEGSPSDTVTSETETTAKASNSIAPAGAAVAGVAALVAGVAAITYTKRATLFSRTA